MARSRLDHQKHLASIELLLVFFYTMVIPMIQFNGELGRGQFGVVYATDSDWVGTPYNTKLAIKALVPSNDRQWGDLAQEYFYMHY